MIGTVDRAIIEEFGVGNSGDMGIQDRGYYQQATAQIQAREQAPAIVGLVVVTISAFVLQQLIPSFTNALALHSGGDFRFWQPLTALLLHADPWHLAWNMVILWWLGRDVERLYGALDLATFYVLAGLTASLAWLFLAPGNQVMVGASGAVMGVVVLSALFYPSRPVWMLVTVPLWLVTLLYMVVDITGTLDGAAEGTAHAAHLGGAALAVVFRFADLRVSKLLPSRPWGRSARGQRATVRGQREGVPVTSALAPSSELQALLESGLEESDLQEGMDRLRMDELLVKVHREGEAALTESEAEFLAGMSRRLREKS